MIQFETTDKEEISCWKEDVSFYKAPSFLDRLALRYYIRVRTWSYHVTKEQFESVIMQIRDLIK